MIEKRPGFKVWVEIVLWLLLTVPAVQGVRLAKIHNNLNKPAVKTIQSFDGDIIDCVRITQQPAFDHPALQNHTLQIPPNVIPSDLDAASSSAGHHGLQAWHQSGQACLQGTVPIRRAMIKDAVRAGATFGGSKMKKSSLASVPTSAYVHEHALGSMPEGAYYGAQCTMNVWSPSVEVGEFSLAQIWIVAGSRNDGDLNTIEAGWQVYPFLYGDSKPRLFVYWTADAYQETGCYNLECSGFVQTSNEIAIGAALAPVSTRAGSQYDIRILIWKEPGSGNWWMQFGGHLVGYWPASIFTHLARSAAGVEFGGEVINSRTDDHHSATAMGSGQYAEKGFAQASYLRNIKYVDGNNTLRTPEELQTRAVSPNCYNIQSSENAEWGTYFYYGGPGLSSNCP